ncbi:FMN-binding negative transcriptional regulator [Acinetobacter variabilis]|uniref:FMN-binding negative transcriptional regulator n=1 Tax=Acinetobacter variabilis TaxID=70346 RepID=UPI0021CEFB23|nr:FMN-binding negative transcriptional regulator [Acinetobacter variabilis]MCU4631007.1 FMN-binding negative transcriptional regulator [Acinetobacter variabilis]
MYLPPHFEERRLELLHDLMKKHPFGCVVTYSNSELNANHLPFEIVSDKGDFGKLLAHISRQNPLAEVLKNDADVLVIFRIDDVYISPNWYVGKFEHHKVVPTWNYVVIHAKGKARIIEDEKVLRGILARLTREHESNQDVPWKMTDAPSDFISERMKHIVGIQIEITDLVGKFKLSQNRNKNDILSVATALASKGKSDLSNLMLSISNVQET